MLICSATATPGGIVFKLCILLCGSGFITFSFQADGYRVWLDVDQMGGSILEAMANGIENAAVVLMCISDKYKSSNSCRTGKKCNIVCRTMACFHMISISLFSS